ncbi:odorant receptor 13a-like [Hylaeus anthracinus]|uniref:odorant receptor 13a-like n=1 Tax=Hylaeus anthracinus TaxID=313031 RepID=UPI0023B91F0E|nr:odorant receptor 13a-like [Hylaeus anthracinus]
MDSEQDLKKAIGWNRINLQLVGIWPEPMSSNERFANCKAVILCLWVIVFVAAPQSIQLFMLGGDIEQMTQNLCLANIPVINAVMKVIVTWYRRKELKPLVKSFYDDWYRSQSEEERTTMLNRAKFTTNITAWCTMLTQTMVTVYISLRAFTIMTCDQSKETQDRLVLYPGYFPYNVRPTVVLVLTNLAQAFAAYCATIPYTSVDTFIAMLVLHICAQFENLRRRLEGLTDEKDRTRDRDQIQKELVSIVERHEHLNWVATKIEECFNLLLLLQLLLCTIEICFQGFLFCNVLLKNETGLLNVQMVFFVLFVSFIIVHMYIYCYIGERLQVQSSGMAISAYKSNWFNVSPPEAKNLIFIICRSTRPLCLTAGKFSTFSMEMFSSILKTSMGYLSVLLTVTSELKSLLKSIAGDWQKKISTSHRRKMVNVARITRITIIRSTLMCNAVVVIYSLLRIFTIKYSGTKLLFRAYFPYDINTSPNYELTVCGQIIAAFYAAISYTAVDTFVAMLVFHVCGQLSILNDQIKELPTYDKTDIRVKLAGVVQKFEYLKKFTETIENCFNLMLLLQMIGCSVQLCFQCFQAIVSIDDEINEFVIFQLAFLSLYVIYVLLQLYLYCYVGDKLLDESTKLADAAYNCEWYNLSANDAKLLVIVIIRARLPLRITAGKFCTLTLVLYSDILKRSMGYISVLYAMKSK